MTAADRETKKYLTGHVYRHGRVMDVMNRAEAVVDELFQRYWQDPAALPADWRLAGDAGADDRARRIADFLAGMTDRYALGEYRRLFGSEADLG
jgi:dGTPase